jgi:hypothetical protein
VAAAHDLDLKKQFAWQRKVLAVWRQRMTLTLKKQFAWQRKVLTLKESFLPFPKGKKKDPCGSLSNLCFWSDFATHLRRLLAEEIGDKG